MRFSLASSSLMALAFTSKALACVNFYAYYDDSSFISASLTDNSVQTCSYDGNVDPSTDSFIWLNCNDGYAATFSWYNAGNVAYSTPSFEGSFATSVQDDSADGTTQYYYTANVY